MPEDPKSPEEIFADIDASIPEDDVAASTEGTAPEQTPEVTPEVPAEVAEGQPRDDAGRFTKPEAAPEVAAPAAIEAPQAPVPSAESTVSAPDLSQYPAYEYRVAGQAVPFKGAVRGSDGVLFTNDSIPALEAQLAKAHQAHERLTHMGRQLADRDRQLKSKDEEKGMVLGKLAEIMSDPDKFDAWALDTQGNWEKLLLEARLKMTEQERDERVSQYESVTSEQEVQALIPQLHSATEEAIKHLVGELEFKDLALDAVWQKEFKDGLFQTHFDLLFTEASEQDIAQGVAEQVGQTVFHPEPILAEMRRLASFARAQVTRNKALADAQARNQQRTAQTTSVPVAGAKPQGAPSSKPKPALKSGMSREEVDRLVFETMMDEQ